MTFITDNFTWVASSICDLYKARWAIEVFFKEIKQTLQLSDFIGYNENAVRWQIWTALLTYILLRFIAWQNEWKHTFTRLFTALRGVIWRCLDIGVQHYVNFYNSRRIHSALQYRTPDEVYFGTCNRQTVGYSKTRVFTPIF